MAGAVDKFEDLQVSLQVLKAEELARNHILQKSGLIVPHPPNCGKVDLTPTDSPVTIKS